MTLLALGDADAAPAVGGANDCGVDGFQDGALAKSMRGYLGPPVGVAEKPLDCLRMILSLVGSRSRSTPRTDCKVASSPNSLRCGSVLRGVEVSECLRSVHDPCPISSAIPLRFPCRFRCYSAAQ